MNESKIPWPIWAAVMLACAVIAAWASRPQTDDQRVEYLQRKISSLEAQLNRQQRTYSPSVSEPTPSPEPTPTSTLTPEPASIPEPTLRLSNPKWYYSAFNSNVKTQDGSDGSYRLVDKPNFDENNRQVQWIAEYISKSENWVVRDFLERNHATLYGFKAKFKDKDGIIMDSITLNADGQGNRTRYTLTIPNSVWQRWSEVSQVIIERI
ncbi:hypothetical protein [Dolichospermum circinale]|uniref:hypothetical protein n=1 Tax=Dolichospermum circinale TaxID=109265 RepID=UPI002330A105|nr:hypothetical protein [Dolichospermum circinale]MDB9459579.1 hypothetical protein [Dolichospermum circinale CS-545/17]MDB9468080.1 hypothetical protein [Dolichospermum circinale CS-539/09]MDB9471327.1 hypothetical protein [Dolichospermum circinale CS-539]